MSKNRTDKIILTALFRIMLRRNPGSSSGSLYRLKQNGKQWHKKIYKANWSNFTNVIQILKSFCLGKQVSLICAHRILHSLPRTSMFADTNIIFIVNSVFLISKSFNSALLVKEYHVLLLKLSFGCCFSLSHHNFLRIKIQLCCFSPMKR